MVKFKKALLYICILIAIALIAALVLYHVPFSAQIDMEVEGVQIDMTGEIQKEVTITLAGQRKDYLFKDDVLAFEVKINEGDTEIISTFEVDSASIVRLEDTISYAAQSVYYPQEETLKSCTFVFEDTLKSFLLLDYDGFQYLFSEDAPLTPDDILERLHADYFLPVPTPINLEMDGKQITTTGREKKDVTITLKGQRVDYPGYGSKLELEITVTAGDTEIIPTYKVSPTSILGSHFQDGTFSAFLLINKPLNGFVGCTLAFDENFQSIFLKGYDEFYYVFAEDPQLTPDEITDKFLAYLD